MIYLPEKKDDFQRWLLVGPPGQTMIFLDQPLNRDSENRTVELVEVIDMTRLKISGELPECLHHQTMIGVGIFGCEHLYVYHTESTWSGCW